MFASVLAFFFSAAYGQTAERSKSTILVIGDSLSAEYGISRNSGWVKIIQHRLGTDGLNYEMKNASISGDTTSGGLSRTPAALKEHGPEVVIIELGSNDALRGLPLDMSRDNVSQMIALAKDAGARVLLVGMQIPPNYGRPYAEQFRTMFIELAKEHGIDLVPFLLENVALDRTLFLDDGLHPNEKAQPIIADNVWAVLKPMLNAD